MTADLARGWLVAWLAFGAAPAGALVLLLIHRITGGRWGEALAPTLRRLALLMPLVGCGFLGVALTLDATFRWAADPGSVKADVARLYLNPPLFTLRGGVTLAGWSALAVLAATGRCSRLVAGLGLAFYGLTISLVAVDWILSVEAPFNSSAFGAAIALHHLLAALALCALAGAPDRGDAPDVANLMLATLLGVLYLGLMSYVVAWYGDLPPKAVWYLRRGTPAYMALVGAAVLAGGLIPFLMLLFAPVRTSPGALRVVGLLVLIGLALHLAWLMLPAWGGDAPAAAALGLALLALLIGLARLVAPRLGDRLRRPRHA